MLAEAEVLTGDSFEGAVLGAAPPVSLAVAAFVRDDALHTDVVTVVVSTE